MTTVNNRKVSLSPRKYGASRAIRKISPPSGKDEGPKQKGFLNRPRRWLGGKSFWDWMQFLVALAIPLAVAGASIWFSMQQANLADLQHQLDQKLAQQQHEADQQNVLDQQRQATLVTYLDNMNDLLLNRGLLTSKPHDEIRVIALTETLSAMRQLDGKRNSILVQFLQDSQLIGLHRDNIVNFEFADLSLTDLRGAHLFNVDLSNADLRSAHLSNAGLYGAKLFDVDLSSADLSNAILSDAILRSADLSNAILSGANLSYADLSNAILTQQQLDQVYSCKNANLSPGLTCHRTPSP